MFVRQADFDQGSRYMSMDTDAIPDSEARMETTLPGRAYRAEEFFDLERERIFFRDWGCVGREATIAAPGAYLLFILIGESLPVVRTREGGIRSFHNVCRHRGSRLVI